MGRQKVPKSDFQSQFSMSKIILIFIEEYQFRKKFFVIVVFENFDFWTTLFSKMVPNSRQTMWTSVKVKSKNYFYLTDFLPKSTP